MKTMLRAMAWVGVLAVGSLGASKAQAQGFGFSYASPGFGLSVGNAAPYYGGAYGPYPAVAPVPVFVPRPVYAPVPYAPVPYAVGRPYYGGGYYGGYYPGHHYYRR